MNNVVDWVSSQEQFLFKDISISFFMVIMSYVFIITLVRLYIKRNFNNLCLMLISILLFQGVLLNKSFNNATNSFIIFHKSRFTLIGEKNYTNLKVYHNFDSITSTNDNVIKNFRVGNFIKEIQYDTIKNIYLINNKKLLVIDSLGAYNVKTFKPHYVLLRNSPKINLNRVIDSLNPDLVIADGSNFKSYVDRWEATCAKQKLPFHQTSKKGAFIISNIF